MRLGLRFAEQCGKTRDAFGTARRALVVIGFAVCDGLGVGTACGVTALRALRLGQQIFNAIREYLYVCHGHDVGVWLAAAQLELNSTLSPISPIAIRNPCAIIEALFRKTAEGFSPNQPVQCCRCKARGEAGGAIRITRLTKTMPP